MYKFVIWDAPNALPITDDNNNSNIVLLHSSFHCVSLVNKADGKQTLSGSSSPSRPTSVPSSSGCLYSNRAETWRAIHQENQPARTHQSNTQVKFNTDASATKYPGLLIWHLTLTILNNLKKSNNIIIRYIEISYWRSSQISDRHKAGWTDIEIFSQSFLRDQTDKNQWWKHQKIHKMGQCVSPELPTDVFIPVLKQQNGGLVDLNSAAFSFSCARMVDIGLKLDNGTTVCHKT